MSNQGNAKQNENEMPFLDHQVGKLKCDDINIGKRMDKWGSHSQL